MVERIFYRMTNSLTPDKKWSEKLYWDFNSKELKISLLIKCGNLIKPAIAKTSPPCNYFVQNNISIWSWKKNSVLSKILLYRYNLFHRGFHCSIPNHTSYAYVFFKQNPILKFVEKKPMKTFYSVILLFACLQKFSIKIIA